MCVNQSTIKMKGYKNQNNNIFRFDLASFSIGNIMQMLVYICFTGVSDVI